MTAKKKKIENPKIISGLLREAMFCSHRFDIAGVTGAEIFKVNESKNKRQNSLVSFELTPECKTSELKELIAKSEIPVKLFYSGFLAEFNSSVDSFLENRIILTVPKLVEIINNRQNKRIPVPHLSDKPCPILLSSTGDHFEAIFSLVDKSPDGYGGILEAPEEISISCGARVLGFSENYTGTIDFSGTIVYLEKRHKKNGLQSYKVGIQKNEKPQYNTNDFQLVDRRSENRTKSQLSISVTSILRPEKKIQLDVEDVSISGFKSSLVDILDISLITTGATLKLENTELLFEVVLISNENIHCQVIYGNSLDRSYWFKKISNFLHKSISSDSALGEELLSIFCESGAFRENYINNNKPYRKEFEKGLYARDEDSGYLHRWINRTQDGELKGHVSAIRLGDNCWLIGDLAGGMKKGLKVDHDLVRKFTSCFREFSLAHSPCLLQFALWKKGHPLWKQFEKKLKTENNKNVISLLNSGLSRINKLESFPDISSVDWEPILPTDYKKIKKIEKKLSDLGLYDFASVFDFSYNRFGSPNLTSVILKAKEIFRRQYILINHQELTFFVIFSKYPLGKNSNRIIDAAWVLQINNSILNENTWNEVLKKIRSVASYNAYNIESVRRVYNYSQTQNISEIEIPYTIVVGLPKIWDSLNKDAE